MGTIELRQKGILVAKAIYERHKTLFRFFHEMLARDPKVAEKNACKRDIIFPSVCGDSAWIPIALDSY